MIYYVGDDYREGWEPNSNYSPKEAPDYGSSNLKRQIRDCSGRISRVLPICALKIGIHVYICVSHCYISRESWTTQNVYRSRASVCLSVCLCVSVPCRIPTLQHGPGCNLGNGTVCPLVVHCTIVRICNRCTGLVAMSL